MNIPPHVLDVLKCINCKIYLSRSPVYLQHDGAAVCDRCFTPNHPATRNTQYEATAKLLKFPCKNQEFGCRVTVPFKEQKEVIAHEEVCEYRRYICPVHGSTNCAWMGRRTDILQHCQTQHPDKVIDHPAILIQDISKASLQTYFLRAFQLLFLLQVKICLVSGKIIHSLSLLEASNATYSYSLLVKRGDEQVLKKGQIGPQDQLTSLDLNTNSLLDVLGGFDGATFTVTVSDTSKQLTRKRKMSDSEEDNSEQPKVECTKCSNEITVLQFRDENGWLCEGCAPSTRPCDNHGCYHADIDSKCRKHELCYCEQRPRCHICKARVSKMSLVKHYTTKHQDITHMTGSTWRATETGQFCLLTSVGGIVMCRYKIHETHFILDIYTSVLGKHLIEFCCEVKIADFDTGYERNYKPDAKYDKVYDWRVKVEELEFPLCKEFDICVEIKRCK